ncbi:MAG: site-2 protease family protein [Bacteroidota bacterium]
MPQSNFKNSAARTYLIHIGLFLLTVVTTTMAGAEWMFGNFFSLIFTFQNALGWQEFWQGLYFSIPFLGILTVHEFGHYFTARAYKVGVSLPFYIPLWLGWLPGLSSLGTMGAFIRLKSVPESRQQYFDIGIAGPLAGFALALGVLFYGYTHLPPKEHIFTIHPQYQAYGLDYEKHVYTYDFMRSQDSLLHHKMQQDSVLSAKSQGKTYQPSKFQPRFSYGMEYLGSNLLLKFFSEVVAPDKSLVPNPHEMMHYPLLLAGYFALFFTALNLIPIGQLDGGHILYSLIGSRRHSKVSPALLVGFMTYAGLGLFTPQSFMGNEVTMPNFLDMLGSYSGLGGNDLVYLNQVGWLALYVGFLYLTFRRMVETKQTAWLISLAIVAVQMLTSTIFPQLQGARFLLVFLFVLGRFLGVYHPPALYDEPLDWKRQVLGWFALVVFVLCFTPEPLVFTEVMR